MEHGCCKTQVLPTFTISKAASKRGPATSILPFRGTSGTFLTFVRFFDRSGKRLRAWDIIPALYQSAVSIENKNCEVFRGWDNIELRHCFTVEICHDK